MHIIQKIIIGLIIFTEAVSAQSVLDHSGITKIIPSFRDRYDHVTLVIAENNTESIFRRNNEIFPKTRTSNAIDSRFDASNFEVNGVFKQNKDVGFAPRAMEGQGANHQFKDQSKRISEDDIPEEFKKLFNK